MRIIKKTFEIEHKFIKSYTLNSNLSYYNLNIKTLCYFEHYKSFALNGYYFKLLPYKISQLKELKALLLNLKIAYLKTIDSLKATDSFKFHYDFKRELPTIYNKLIESNSSKLPLTNELLKEHRAYLSSYSTLNNTQYTYTDFDSLKSKIESLQINISIVDKAIKKYQRALKLKIPYFKFKINDYDLFQLELNHITNNIKALSYYYLIKLKKAHISQRALSYLQSKEINILLLNYCSNKELIKKDFNSFLEIDKATFKEQFLNKTI